MTKTEGVPIHILWSPMFEMVGSKALQLRFSLGKTEKSEGLLLGNCEVKVKLVVWKG